MAQMYPVHYAEELSLSLPLVGTYRNHDFYNRSNVPILPLACLVLSGVSLFESNEGRALPCYLRILTFIFRYIA